MALKPPWGEEREEELQAPWNHDLPLSRESDFYCFLFSAEYSEEE